ncbi:hypothetical protein [Streptomyces sp. NPDC059949]|uniref:hypothetical protein n=1 Tax=Streptomyces sp. NPDC059949 TaxID=3347013 RepID=UPI00365DF018
MLRAGAWVATDPTLQFATDGKVVPKTSAVSMAFSGGGTGALLTGVKDGRTLSLTWDKALPKPTLAANVATYTNVLPDADLQLKAEVEGFSQLLVVKTAAAARHPDLARLKFKLGTVGLSVSADPATGMPSAVNPAGQKVFTASAPMMWDSTTTGAPAPAGSAGAGALAAGEGAAGAPSDVFLMYSGWSETCSFSVDRDRPSKAPRISSTDFPDGSHGWPATTGKARTPGSFTLSANGVSDVVWYGYHTDWDPEVKSVPRLVSGLSAIIKLTPPGAGPHFVYAVSQDKAGNRSDTTAHLFYAGRSAARDQAGDLNGDGNSDIWSNDSFGSLLTYAGQGNSKFSTTNGGAKFGTPRTTGSGGVRTATTTWSPWKPTRSRRPTGCGPTPTTASVASGRTAAERSRWPARTTRQAAAPTGTTTGREPPRSSTPPGTGGTGTDSFSGRYLIGVGWNYYDVIL